MSKSYVMNTYGRYDVSFEKGKGAKIYDTEGNEYIDFVSGVAVNCLGHANPVITNAITEQSQKLMHISNYYWNENAKELAKILCENSNHEKVFFCNSGAEAIETALKLARKYGSLSKTPDKNEIIYMENSFHGRTMGALSVTGQAKYQESFKPLIGNVKSVKFNDLDEIETAVSEKTCAIIVEPIQGEGGIIKAQVDFLKKLRELCDKFDAVLIFDEVQCGIGRTGSLFAYKKFGVVPDVICMAKALGGGFPIGAAMANKKVAEAFVPGDHGNTYGGNPLAAAVSLAIMKELINGGVISKVDEKAKYIVDRLEEMKEKYSQITEIRGMGLLIGICLDTDIKAFTKKCFDKRLLVITAGSNVVRLLPPLNVTEEEMKAALDTVEEVFEEIN
jgi:acetylornithine/N-succinyldiaminopimelate aminotransferase